MDQAPFDKNQKYFVIDWFLSLLILLDSSCHRTHA